MSGVHSNAVEITKTVPTFISPDGELAKFQIDTFYVNSGEITLQLSGIPILVKKINVTGISDEQTLITAFNLKQNYPNPFGKSSIAGNSVTTIEYSIPNNIVIARSKATKQSIGKEQIARLVDGQASSSQASPRNDAVNVSMFVYDVLGRKIATLVDKEQTPGIYRVKFNAANLPSGVYFYRLKAGGFIKAKKMLIIN